MKEAEEKRTCLDAYANRECGFACKNSSSSACVAPIEQYKNCEHSSKYKFLKAEHTKTKYF